MKAIFWHVMNYSITSAYLVLTWWVIVSDMQTTVRSRTETYTTYQLVARQVCKQNSREVCSGWWTGRQCSTEYYCDQVTETAVESVTSTRCQKGWSPYPSCNEINECTEGISGCEHNCTDTVSSYICSCNAGYRLTTNGRSCNDIDECAERTSQCAQLCFNTGGSYTCGCNSSYVLASDRRTCTYVSKCPTSTCQQTCNETKGNFTCGCYAGYRLSSDGRSCNDTDECAAGISGCSDICNNTIGSYTCGCHSGYTLANDRRLCQDIDECQKISTCSQHCNNTIGSYICGCNSGYGLASDNRSCQDIDECTATLDNCTELEHFICENTIGGYQCVCKIGFEQVGPLECRDINECETLTDNCTLYENTTCENIIGSYKCEGQGLPGDPAGSNWISDASATGTIVVTVCVVVGVALIIVAVVCSVKCAKRRRLKKAPKDAAASSADLAEENVYDDIEMTNNATTIQTESRDPDSKEAVNGLATSTKNSKSFKGLFKSQKEKKDLKIGTTAAINPTYQELSEAAKVKSVYESIKKKPTDSIDISMQGEAENDSSHA